MKVILLKDVAKIGRRFEIIDVPDGFALNKLIPKNMAQFATPENVKRIMAVATKQKEHSAHDTEVFSALLKRLETVPVSIEVEANAEGRMFQSLKAESVVEAIKNATTVVLSKDAVVLKEPIKTVGLHTIELASGKTLGHVSITLTAKSK